MAGNSYFRPLFLNHYLGIRSRTSRPIDVIVVDGKNKVPLSPGLIDIHLQDLVLGKSHLVEAVKYSGGAPRRCRKRTGTFLRVEVALVVDAPLSLFPALYDEGGAPAS